jgi:hypothetical protein
MRTTTTHATCTAFPKYGITPLVFFRWEDRAKQKIVRPGVHDKGIDVESVVAQLNPSIHRGKDHGATSNIGARL